VEAAGTAPASAEPVPMRATSVPIGVWSRRPGRSIRGARHRRHTLERCPLDGRGSCRHGWARFMKPHIRIAGVSGATPSP